MHAYLKLIQGYIISLYPGKWKVNFFQYCFFSFHIHQSTLILKSVILQIVYVLLCLTSYCFPFFPKDFILKGNKNIWEYICVCVCVCVIVCTIFASFSRLLFLLLINRNQIRTEGSYLPHLLLK